MQTGVRATSSNVLLTTVGVGEVGTLSMSITHRLVVDVMGSWIGGTPFLLRLPGVFGGDGFGG